MNRAILDQWLLAWPGVTADLKWGNDLAYCVAGKMFAVLGLADDQSGAVSLKTERERFIELTARPGIDPAPYLARYFWIAVRDDDALDTREWRALLRASYEAVAAKLPKRIREGL